MNIKRKMQKDKLAWKRENKRRRKENVQKKGRK